jgi:group I intron endonuclease
MKSGIYLIENLVNGKKYIGQSLNVSLRKGKHFSALRNRKHENIHLQRAYDKYGESDFSFKVIEFCEIDDLDSREIHFISEYRTMINELGYNLESGGNKGKIVSEETRMKKVGENNPRFGVEISEETRGKLISTHRGCNAKLTEADVVEIKLMLIGGASQLDVSQQFGVDYTTVNKIAKFKNWQYVREDLNARIIESEARRNFEKEESVKKLLSAGKSVKEIERLLNVSHGFVVKVQGYKKTDMLESRNRDIVSDFESGLTKSQIMNKYGISSAVYVSVTKEAYNKQNDEMKKKAVEMRRQGILVSSIASELGLHRTTVTEWTKHLSPRQR